MSRTNYFRRIGALALPLLDAAPLRAQEAIDTTGLGYQIGYNIGSWLPFLVIILLVVLILRKSARQGQG